MRHPPAATLRRLYYEDGRTLQEIGAEYGVSKQAVSLWFKKAGVAARSQRTPEHGTISMYSNQRCRCDRCRKAHTIYAWKKRRAAGARMIAGEAAHGTISRYKHHRCRCDLCRAANSKYAREARARAKVRAGLSR